MWMKRNFPAYVRAMALAVALAPAIAEAGDPAALGIKGRILPRAYLAMPHRADGKIPRLLSQTGAFAVTHDVFGEIGADLP